jgi:hypothetical protein
VQRPALLALSLAVVFIVASAMIVALTATEHALQGDTIPSCQHSPLADRMM